MPESVSADLTSEAELKRIQAAEKLFKKGIGPNHAIHALRALLEVIGHEMPEDIINEYPHLDLKIDPSLKVTKFFAERQDTERYIHGLTGESLLRLNKPEHAIPYFVRMRDIAIKLKNRTDQGVMLGYLGDAYSRLGEYRLARHYFEERLVIARELKDIARGLKDNAREKNDTANELKHAKKELEYTASEARTLSNIGTAYLLLGDPREAIKIFRQSYEIAEKIKLNDSNLITLGNLSNAFYKIGDFFAARDWAQKTLALAKEMGDITREGTVSIRLGSAWHRLGEYESAIGCFSKGLEIARVIRNPINEAYALGSLGNVYYSVGNYKKAEECHQASLELAIKLGDKGAIVSAHSGLGNVYAQTGPFHKAIEHHEEHLRIAESLEDRLGVASAKGNLGTVYSSLGNHKKALELHQDHYQISREVGDRAGTGIALDNMGNAYQRLGPFYRTDAVRCHHQRLEIAIEIGDISGEGCSHGNLGLFYKKSGDWSLALFHLDKQLEIARRIKSKSDEFSACGSLADLYLQCYEPEQAFDYYMQSIELAENLNDTFGLGISYANFGRFLLLFPAMQHKAQFTPFTALNKGIEYLDSVQSAAKESDKTTFMASMKTAYSNFEKLKEQVKHTHLELLMEITNKIKSKYQKFLAQTRDVSLPHDFNINQEKLRQISFIVLNDFTLTYPDLIKKMREKYETMTGIHLSGEMPDVSAQLDELRRLLEIKEPLADNSLTGFQIYFGKIYHAVLEVVRKAAEEIIKHDMHEIDTFPVSHLRIKNRAQRSIQQASHLVFFGKEKTHLEVLQDVTSQFKDEFSRTSRKFLSGVRAAPLPHDFNAEKEKWRKMTLSTLNDINLTYPDLIKRLKEKFETAIEMLPSGEMSDAANQLAALNTFLKDQKPLANNSFEGFESYFGKIYHAVHELINTVEKEIIQLDKDELHTPHLRFGMSRRV